MNINDRYIEIFLNKRNNFDVQVRWCVDGEQHEYWEFETIQELNTFLEKFYK